MLTLKSIVSVSVVSVVWVERVSAKPIKLSPRRMRWACEPHPTGSRRKRYC